MVEPMEEVGVDNLGVLKFCVNEEFGAKIEYKSGTDDEIAVVVVRVGEAIGVAAVAVADVVVVVNQQPVSF